MGKIVKIIGLIFLLLTLLFAAIFLGQGVKTYFVKASTCPAQKIATVQVTANSAVVSWETADVTQGRVEYGTSASNLTFSAPEASSGKLHNIPLTLLTPNTVYYYLVTIGKNRCDSTGKTCTDACVPWSFTTTAITPQQQIISSITPSPTITVSPTLKIASPSATIRPSIIVPSPTSSLSSFCSHVKTYLGENNNNATKWATIKQYDIDNNNVINGLDIIKCQKAGK